MFPMKLNVSEVQAWRSRRSSTKKEKKGRSFQLLCRHQQGECVGSLRQIETSAKQNTPFGVCVSERPDLRGQVVSHRVPVIANDGIKRYFLRVGRYDFPKLPGQEDRPSLSIRSCKDSCVGGTVLKIWTFKFHSHRKINQPMLGLRKE